jgi:hypothetical protein
MNLSAQEYLAKLLAKENLSVQHGNYSTASFDVMNRVLRLPLWEDKGKDVYDLLVGHEVGHALYTPADGWHDSEKKIGKIPRAYLNIVEDIRIERMIQETYPGIVRRFKNGYKRLFDDNLFGTDDRDINKAGLMDRLNVSSKGRGYVPVEFSDEESPLVKEAMEVKTWDDVLKVCQKLFDWVNENEEEEEKPEGSDATFPSNEMAGDDDAQAEKPEGSTPPEDDEEMDEEGEGEGSESDSESKEKETEEKKSDKHSPWTEENFRKNEKDLLETKEDKYDKETKQSTYSAGISDENLEKIVFTYKEAAAKRIEWCEENQRDIEYSAYGNPAVTADWEKSKPGLNSTANLLAKDFERKKAAFEYSRALTAKTGKLDPLKLHAYKTSEDIFLTTTQLAQAKSHGIMMFVDYSGSMCDIIEDVTNQAITIAMFCRKVHIPFEVYSFTTAGWHGRDLQDEIVVKGNEIDDLTKIKVVEMFSSKMNNKTFEEASKEAFGISKAHSYRRDSTYYIAGGQLHTIDAMGSTPLIQTTILAAKLTKAFQRKHAIQKTNIMILTDGYPDTVGINDDEHADVKTHRNNKMINFNGKIISGESARELYTNCLIRLKEITGAKMFGFHLAVDASSFGQGYWDVKEKQHIEFKDVMKKWRKEGHLVWKKQKGYDDYFIIKVGQKHVDDEFEPQKTETIRDIRNEFKKFNKNKKHTKQLVAKITDAVAA